MEIPKIYEPQKYEDKIYEMWEKSGKFNPDNLKLPKGAKNYSIIMPPPNVTGVLHMGSAMMLAVEDLLIRYQRMQGKRTVWIPGTDHAAIATQNRVEKNLRKVGISRHTLGRDKFLEQVEEFAENSKKTIISQMRKMGSSCDWTRLAYTMDETRTRAVRTVFKLMHEDGLIYRGERIVNWCPRCLSTLADDEVEHQKQKGKLYFFRYSQDFPITIATTRPETKLGDTAVAVNPKDERYKKYIGKEFSVDFAGVPLKIKIISDRNVDMNFGTGAVGVTPAHSMVDWQMAEKNKLAVVKVIDEKSSIREGFGKYSGHHVLEAREMIVKELRSANLIQKEEKIENNISVCYRCETVIEPLPSLQWFIDVNKKIPQYGKSIKELSNAAVKSGVFKRKKINIIPDRFEKNYFHWTRDLHDWCISRQIWFGHRIPVWYRDSKASTSPSMPTGRQATPLLSKERGAKEEIYVGVEPPKGKGWRQDEDTLDTWFSSGLWSFSTMAHKPGDIKIEKDKIKINTKDFKQFHPTAVLETMYDILFFWVARMIIMTTYAVGDIPFQDVYLHGCVRDKFGDKMSKSKPETNIDPLDVCEKYGTDAVRLSLLIGTTPGNDTKVYEEKISNLRNFVTKLWNIYRYSATTYPNFKLIEKLDKKDIKTVADKWIVSRLNKIILESTKHIEEYKFSLAGEKLQSFVWDEFADWYLEISKLERNEKVLGYVLDKILKLAHPFTPFVTEKIYSDANQRIHANDAKRNANREKMLMVEKWPVADKKLINQKAEKTITEIQEVITKIRNIRTNYHIEPASIIEAYTDKKIGEKEIIEKLARINLAVGPLRKKGTITISTKNIRLALDVSGQIDVEKEKIRLQKEIGNLENLVSKNEALLKNKNFLASAPESVVASNRERLADYKTKLVIQRELLKNLS